MGDWYHVHHCVICGDHRTALRVYERVEVAARSSGGPSGWRWGFWNPRVVLLTTTDKWSSSPSAIEPIIAGLQDITCLTWNDADEKDEDENPYATFERSLREHLRATRDFLWSDREDVMDALLTELAPYDTGLTTVALRHEARVPKAAMTAIASHRYSDIVHGFLTEDGGCFALGYFNGGDGINGDDETRIDSPLFTPLAAPRQRGSAWAIHIELDGNQLLPVHVREADLWQIERHGGHAGWQLRPQRVALARAALTHSSSTERQAGCAMVRRWHLRELTDLVAARMDDADPYVVEAAALAVHDLGRSSEKHQASDTPVYVDSSIHLAEVREAFDRHVADPQSAAALLQTIADMAQATVNSPYWMVRYGILGDDGPPEGPRPDDPVWSGETGASAARIIHWARCAIEASLEPPTSETLLRSLNAFDQMLDACHDNGSWMIPPLGLIHARLNAALTHPNAGEPLPPPDLRLFLAKKAHAAKQPSGSAFEYAAEDALMLVPPPDLVWCASQYGRHAPTYIAWLANNLAWQRYLRGAYAEALPYAIMSMAYGDSPATCDTFVRTLLALSREDEAYTALQRGLARADNAAELKELSEGDGFRRWLERAS